MASKADQVRAWLNGSELNSREIAEVVGCHDGFVRAIKQRMLHPERERARNNARSQDPEYRERRLRLQREARNNPEYRKKDAEKKRAEYWRRRNDAAFMASRRDRNKRWRDRLKQAEPHANG